jgi:hypothetical protein
LEIELTASGIQRSAVSWESQSPFIFQTILGGTFKENICHFFLYYRSI